MKALSQKLTLTSLALVAMCMVSAPAAHASSPISITSCAQMELIGSGNPAYAATSTYILNGPSNVIDCSAINTGNGFYRIQNFSGTFNGNGNTITGLYENDPSNTDVGLFEDIESGGLVENFTIASSTIIGFNNVGVVAGILNSGTIQNVTVGSGSVTGTSTAQNIGGLLGENNGTVASSSAAVTVQGVTEVGGLVGENDGTISNSSASGAVSSNDPNALDIGGLVGSDDGAGGGTTNSFATGNVTANGSNVQSIGGLVGVESFGLSGSYATGNVIAGLNAQNVGGLIGNFTGGAVTYSYASGNVTGGQNSQMVGGLIGNSDGTSVSFDHSSGTVSGNVSVGGLIGYSDVPVSDSYTSSAVTIVGNNTGSGPINVGGFIGQIDGTTISDSYATGNVSLSGTFTSAPSIIGGFDGLNGGTITNTYASGNVTVSPASTDVGGHTGHSGATLTYSFSTGIVTAPGSMQVGGFIGAQDNGILANDSWYTGSSANSSGYDQIYGAPALHLLATEGYGTDEATSTNFYNVTEPVYALGNGGWDFNSVWVPNLHGYPTLGVSSTTFSIAASASTGGTITPAGPTVVVARNASQSFTIVPSAGYYTQIINVDGSSASTATTTYTFTHVYTPHLISVIFGLIPVATPAPTPTAYYGGSSSGGGSVPNQVSNLLANGNASAATTLMQEYPNLFTASGTSVASAGISASAPSSVASAFVRSLTLGSSGADVKMLQKYLNAHGFVIATTGAGSAGNETTYFGKATRAALAKFQAAKGITPASGYFGVLTRAYLAAQ